MLKRSGLSAIIESSLDFIKVSTPKNPNYWWGNYVIFRNQDQFAVKYIEWVKKCFENNAEIKHVAFYVDGARIHDIPDEFTIENLLVMAKTGTKPTYNQHDIRQLHQSNFDELKTLTKDVWHRPEEDVSYLDKKLMESFHSDNISIFGLYRAGKLVGSANVIDFPNWKELDEVQVHPNARNNGYCNALIANALSLCSSKPIYLIAEKEGDARQIYEKHGFEVLQQQTTYCLHDEI